MSFWLAFKLPGLTESIYGELFYPIVARGFALVNRVSFSLAEPAVLMVLLGMLLGATRLWRRRERRWRRLARWTWTIAGIVGFVFLTSWGLNYARPTLAERARLDAGNFDAETVLAAGERAARVTASLFDALDDTETPTTMPTSFEALNRELDEAFERIELTGDRIDFVPVPAKPLASSTLWSYLGISGIFIPFTGEPSINALQPDAALPIVVAHEKAHQRGVTDEGEANFAAFLACADDESPPYLRYAAYSFATRYLIGSASAYLPRERIEPAWALLGDGPLEDLRAIREFWQQYEGPAATLAQEVNDRYLRTMQVPGGVQSYGTVVTLLMALDERGELFPG